MKVETSFLRYAITPAQLLYKSTPTKTQRSVRHGEVKIEQTPVKLIIDNRAFRDAMGMTSLATQARSYAQKGRQAARDATGRYAREGNMMLGPNAMSPAEISAARGKTVPRSELTFIPAEKPRLHWSGGEVNIRAERDETDITFQPYDLDFRYIPFSIEYYLDK